MLARPAARQFVGAVLPLILVAGAGCGAAKPENARAPSSYLVVWAGPNGGEDVSPSKRHAETAPDFVAVIDADSASANYGALLATKDVGVPGAMAHHAELTLPAGHPLFTSDFVTGQMFLVDVSDPLAPKVTARIDSVAGYRRPHSFARLANGNVLVAMQNGNGTQPGDPGALVELDPAGRVLRSSSAADPAFPNARIRPNGIELLPGIDRMVTTSMPMDDEVTADVVQIWRMSDLKLLHTLPVPQLPGRTGMIMPYDTRVLADGRTAMLDTYYCGFYRVSGIESDKPQLDLVHALHEPKDEACAVAVVIGHYWVVPVANGRSIVSMDVTDAAHPVEVSRLRSDSTFYPHWLSVDPASDRIVVGSADGGEPRVLIARLDRATGKLSWDARFHDAGSSRLGVNLDRPELRHGSASHVMGHAALFGPAAKP